jgi:hypothetical protein
MKNSKALSFSLIITAVILGWTLFKKFDFETLKFEKPALAAVYILGFAVSLYLLIKNVKHQPKK